MGGKPVQSHYPALFSRISGPLCSLKALTRATPTRLLLAAHKPHASELVVGNERILAVVLLADSLRKSLIVDEHSYLIILGPSSDLWEGAITRWSLPMLQLASRFAPTWCHGQPPGHVPKVNPLRHRQKTRILRRILEPRSLYKDIVRHTWCPTMYVSWAFLFIDQYCLSLILSLMCFPFPL